MRAVLGIGTDILKKTQILSEHLREDDPFFLRAYSDAEREEARRREGREDYLRGRFSGKEAVFKALCTEGDAVRFSEIEILTQPGGMPRVVLHGRAKEIARQGGIDEILLSLSCDGDYCLAFALAQGRAAVQNEEAP